MVVLDLDEAPETSCRPTCSPSLAAPEPDITLVVTHKSGQRGKKVLDTLKKGGARVSRRPPSSPTATRATSRCTSSGQPSAGQVPRPSAP